ncbi:MAG: S8 family serine peptidase [Planctomycetes bacterium]|nr:S8 family serine peptidase [Planctomycetota bacterium]
MQWVKRIGWSVDGSALKHIAVATGVILAVMGTTAAAAELLFYSTHDRAHVVVRSETEFVVELDASDLSRGAASLRDAGMAELRSIPWNPGNSRKQILDVQSTSRVQRDAVRALRGIKSVHPVYRFKGHDELVLSSGTLVVKLVPGLSEQEREEFFQSYGLGEVVPAAGLRNVYRAAPVIDPDEDEVVCAAAMHLDNRTVYAHPNFIVPMRPLQVAPSDQFYNLQWHLNNTGQDGGTPGADIEVLGAWQKTLGEDVRIGIFDDSVDVDHEDLRGNYLDVGHDPFNNDGDPRPKNIGDRHGTAVLGLICADANGVGVRGVAPLARFTASRALTEFLTNAETASVFTFARQQNVDVHNNSWGGPAFFPDPLIVVDAIETAFVEGRGGRGMVIVFASGNEARELEPGFDLSALPTVIGVGASSALDLRASYSNFGEELDVMAPSGEDFLPGMVTTDNDDEAGYAEPGYNNDGFNDFGFPNLPDPSYTDDFSGTSAACPVTSGVAALCVSMNPNLTATQVRTILEHTAEKIAATDAQYDAITGRSFRYGFGRINARAAVDAADESTTNGGLTWPEPVADISVNGTTISWTNNEDLRTVEVDGEDEVLGDEVVRVLVVGSTQSFSWIPEDGDWVPDPFDPEIGDHVGTEVVDGVFIVKNENVDSHTFTEGVTQFFGIFAANGAGRYSWGVLVDSDGNIVGGGEIIDTGGGGTGGDDGGNLPVPTDPSVTISVTPSSGPSPLTVSFSANALSDSAIVSNEWDFGDGSSPVDSRTATHTYQVLDGTAQTFIATFTARDEEGDVGSRSFGVNIDASSTEGSTSGPVLVSINVETGTGVKSTQGTSPFSVNLSFSTDNQPDGSVVTAVAWELGDGDTASSFSVPHTYTNNTSGTLTFPVTLTLTIVDSFGQTIVTNPVTELITVFPGSDGGNTGGSAGDGDGDSDGVPIVRNPTDGDTTCGAGLLVMIPGFAFLALTRRRFVSGG